MSARFSSKLGAGPDHPNPSFKKNTEKINTPPTWCGPVPIFVFTEKEKKLQRNCRLTPTPRSLPA